MSVYTAPEPYQFIDRDRHRVFLGGTIDMGQSDDWQTWLIEKLAGLPRVDILNPRRRQWAPDWEQSLDCPEFVEQVRWEFDAMQVADTIVMYFAPGSRSPISIGEVYLNAHRGSSVVVCCPTGFWRKGNIDILCLRYGLHQVDSLEDLAAFLHRKLA